VRGRSEIKIKVSDDEGVSSPERLNSTEKVRTPKAHEYKEIETINEEQSDEDKNNSVEKTKR